MSTFSHPTLPRSDIVAILSESQIVTIWETDLINPSPKFVSDVYASLLIHLDLLQDDHGQVDFVALQRFENPDMHVDSVRVMNLFNKIKEILAAVGCPVNFTLDDLVRPDTHRTAKFLSAIINFILHKLFTSKSSCISSKCTLNAEIAQYNEAREKEMPLVEEIDAKIKELRQTVSNLNNHQLSLRASLRKLKEKSKELDEKISRAEFDLVQSVQENANLQSRIVQSPDKLQRALVEKNAIQLEAKNSESLAMQTYQEKSAIVDAYTKALKKMSKHFAQMQAIQEQVNSAKSIEKEVKQLKTKLSDEGVLEMSLEAKVVERQGKAEQLDEYRRQLEKERDLRCEEAKKELNNVKLDVESRRHDLEARERNVEALLAEVDAVTSKMNSCKDLEVSKQQELLKKCEEVVNEFHQYSHTIMGLLSKIDVAGC
ncbi:hypothetical protein Nepgr_027557 [Nepenthes gracilis]|uniref:Kinetochore protein Nuf2 N-terminal domain-containing protein n=1 Tax=Nepenthes gracilis TaxID=150966 RepID=A0AAD3TB08_NEPGR|nr:hypothetical protein Nepgr_027557 [Nepenthes gracilis]